ncbi:alpha-xylosidase [Alistipes finegoldii]|uniref:Alpha-xylosidase n=1 Tax=Alistipes finegoldii TaxID=214856 RepID=A0AA37NQ78_9BACT|nr:glycoside hydrolase family 31 protein [Alistipes finegoldii]BDF62834.1 alpha-xylosidase [Alistipes finegoldii]GKI17412.1 alpha-xylosidase [Alistipes finegoldii]
MKRFLALLTALACTLSPAVADNPKADAKAVVTSGNARFTVLTPQLIRMEWSADGQFEDHATLTFVNRETPVPEFKVRESKSKLTITTPALTLTYLKNGKFSDQNLKAVFTLNGREVVWTPGMENPQNLLGTTRTLDGADGSKLKEPMEQGILSRAGWSLIDDSQRHVLTPDGSEWEEWVEARPEGDRQDLYLFAYGHDYKQALADYALVAGRAPMPPKYTLGYWWSRYWQYSDNEFVDLVNKLKSMDVPIDVLIVDMDWHETWGLRKSNSPKDEYGQRIGWTGYTWQKELFPSPANFLKWTENEELKVALNLHPASGIQPYEAVYDDFTKEYGWSEKGKSVPFKIDERKWADAYFKTVLEPMERNGVDFWWLDWQQWKESKYTPGLSNTFWLNHTFFNHAERQNPRLRPFIYHRWGGLGSHRYPLAFSGDTYATWPMLAYLPYFTATASNVNYGWWGHDIGGHMFHKTQKATDPELYTRWLQYGVFTPIFKTHSTKDPRIERCIWCFPDHMFLMRDAIRLRYTLAPYIYNAARENYDTGVGMCRPMYYDYPESDKAYETPEQFMFGNDILATTITQPVDSITGLAPRTIWFPEGTWFDCATGSMYEGGRTEELHYTLAENPHYAKAGSIIPMNPATVKNLQLPCDTLVLTFIPGGDGQLRHYEDDGMSQQYKTNYAVTTVTKKQEGNTVRVRISPREGSFAGASDSRSYELRFPAVFPPKSVKVNGKELAYSRFPKAGEWTYDGYTLAPVIYTGTTACDAPVEIELAFDDYATAHQADLYGMSGVFKRCLDLTVEFKTEQGAHSEPYLMLPEEYLRVSQCPNFILEEPFRIAEFIGAYAKNKAALFEKTDSMTIIGDNFKQRLKAVIGSVK